MFLSFTKQGFSNAIGLLWRRERLFNISGKIRMSSAALPYPICSEPLSYNVVPLTRSIGTDEEIKEYRSVFRQILKDLIQPYADIPEIPKRFARVLEENVFEEQTNPGMLMITAYKGFQSNKSTSTEDLWLANVLGWCTDMILNSYQITDDILDTSTIRSGIPCWYTRPGIGLTAMNDSVMVSCSAYTLLDKYFSKHPCYIPAVQLFNRVMLETAFGQTLDTICIDNGKPRLDFFTPHYHKYLMKYKGTIAEFVLPISLAMYLSGNYDKTLEMEIMNILSAFGEYYVIQNDMLDCYGDSLLTGKNSTDIRDGACSWLVVNAVQRATKAQKEILMDHYGQDNPESEQKIKQLYAEMGIFDDFFKYKERSKNFICNAIENSSKGLPRDFFHKVVKVIYCQS